MEEVEFCPDGAMSFAGKVNNLRFRRSHSWLLPHTAGILRTSTTRSLLAIADTSTTPGKPLLQNLERKREEALLPARMALERTSVLTIERASSFLQVGQILTSEDGLSLRVDHLDATKIAVSRVEDSAELRGRRGSHDGSFGQDLRGLFQASERLLCTCLLLPQVR